MNYRRRQPKADRPLDETAHSKRASLRRQGFTLIELLIVITVIGILSIGGMGSFRASQINSRNAKRTADLEAIRQALELYRVDNGQYPPNGINDINCDSSVVAGGQNCSNGEGPLILGGAPDWGAGGDIKPDLVPTYISKLPVDPKNDNYFYYFYEPNCGGTDANHCGGSSTCPANVCCTYRLGVSQLETLNGSDPGIYQVCSP